MQDARQKEVMAGLKQEVANLTRLVEAGAGLTLGQESAVNDLLKQKEELQQEHDAQVGPSPFFAFPESTPPYNRLGDGSEH